MRKFFRVGLVAFVSWCWAGGTVVWSEDLFDQPGVSVGLAFAFKGGDVSMADVGLTTKVLSNRHENNPVLGAGVTLYPWADQKIGFDAGVGYNFSHVTPMLSYDFLQNKIQLSAGVSNTKQSKKRDVEEPRACLQNLDCAAGEICLSGLCVGT